VESPPDNRRDDRLLLGAATFFAVAVLIHNSDHARRGANSVGRDVFWIGTAAIAIEVGVVVFALQRHRLAPLVAAAVGLSLAPAYVFVHFLPRRSWLSDSFTSGTDVSPLSWIAASVEIVAAATLGVAGLVALRRRGGLVSATRPNLEQTSLRTAILHPVALAMIIGNVAIVAISAGQL